MHRINTSGATPDNKFQNGDVATGTPSTVLDAAWANSVQEEVCGVVEAFGLTLDVGNDAQLLAALRLLGAQLAPAGVVQAFAGGAAPAGWLECAGQSLARATYPALFAAIGTTYGAADVDHFTLPNLRGEFLRGWDHGRGVDAGREIGSWQDWSTGAPQTTTPQHLNPDGSTRALNGVTNPSVVGFARPSKAGENATANSSDATQPILGEPDVLNVATGDAETRPRNLAMMFIIKT